MVWAVCAGFGSDPEICHRYRKRQAIFTLAKAILARAALKKILISRQPFGRSFSSWIGRAIRGAKRAAEVGLAASDFSATPR
jgi:hypothetical protein